MFAQKRVDVSGENEDLQSILESSNVKVDIGTEIGWPQGNMVAEKISYLGTVWVQKR